MQRRTTAAAVALLAPLALVACGGGDDTAADATGEVTSLTVQDYYNNEPDNTVYQEALEACGQQVGVSIERTSVPGDSLIAKVLQQSSSRTLPDILMLDNPDLQQIAASGALAPLGDFGLSAEGYAEGVVDASTYDGELYGLQPVTNTIALYYNEDVLAQAGVRPPTTWEELKTAAAALTQGDRYGIAFSGINTYEGTWQFLPFMWSNGGSETEIASPENAEALQLWVDLVRSGSASEAVVGWAQADVNDQFKAGNAAMMINGPWQNPTLNETAGLNYGIAPIPVPQAGDEAVAPLGGETWTIPQTGDEARQAAAAEVVECLTSDENQLALAEKRFTVPTKTAVAERYGQQVPEMQAFVDMVPTLRARTGELGEEWPEAATKIYTGVQTALTGGAEPLAALQQAENG
ncbi:sugar ABC transporter substrate-binding protein [Kineococcus glutinatus]|uniref:Sugar ABC transporter substrate-binding protein n=1 Tax=Kineococcus glutinatus TaxID=1070872 RepID=A0ABP9HM63_9ACTN